jgi:hypothetical protein
VLVPAGKGTKEEDEIGTVEDAQSGGDTELLRQALAVRAHDLGQLLLDRYE